jgi:hypothetical protein
VVPLSLVLARAPEVREAFVAVKFFEVTAVRAARLPASGRGRKIHANDGPPDADLAEVFGDVKLVERMEESICV